MNKLSEVVHISKRRESRKGRVVPLAEFEPYFNQLRTALDASQDEAGRHMGYGGGSMFSTWREEGVPIVALNAIRWCLLDLKQEVIAPVRPTPRQFTFDELTDLFDAVRDRPLPEDARRAIIKKLAAELAR